MPSSLMASNLQLDSAMTQNQLVDALTSHIALYHSQSRSPDSYPSPNPTTRSSVLKWFSLLSVNHRRAHLTVVDSSFVRVVLQMLATRRTRGHGLFIVLPDLLSGDLPSVCFKRSHGLLSRVSESSQPEQAVRESARFFSSREGEGAAECSPSARSLDSATLSEEFVADFDRFVEVMDGLSDGGFLRCEASDMGSDWIELEWLKDKGYYSVEAFVANRLEVALRLAWLNHSAGNGKKRGVKLKEKLAASGVAANLYWRKKGCVDWWDNLNSATKKKILAAILGKSARNLCHEILKGASSASEDEFWLSNTGVERSSSRKVSVNKQKNILADSEFGLNIDPVSVSGRPAFLSNALNSLFVLQEVGKMAYLCEDSSGDRKIFFTTFSSVCTVSDFILRKVRGLLMVMSLDFTKHELIAEENFNSPPIKPKGKANACSRKKKGRARKAKKPDPVCESIKDQHCALESTESKKTPDVPREMDICNGTSPFKEEMEFAKPAVGNTQSAARKARRGKGKKRTNGYKDLVDNSIKPVIESCSSTVAQEEAENRVSTCSTSQGKNSAKNNCIEENHTSKDMQDSKSAEYYQMNKSVTENGAVCSGLENTNCCADEYGDNKPEPKTDADVKSAPPEKKVRVYDVKKKAVLIQEQDGRYLSDTTHSSSSHGPPYEWPHVASTNFLPRNPTDRLHLDVGHNWHHHFHHPFLPAIHQHNIDNVCNPILPRRLPMSLDWPPMVRGACALGPSMARNCEPGYISRWHCTNINDERIHSGNFTDLSELASKHELPDEWDSHLLSEDEVDMHVDYNQHFGNGVMYWDASDRPTASFSRPPSLSSDDSSWAWREADMTRAVDDMVAFSSPYSTTALTSPTASFCSPFDTLGPGFDAMSEDDACRSLTDLTNDVERKKAKTGDSLPYHILPPIIIPNIRSRSEFKGGHEIRSPCLSLTRREQPRVKRPPSPVVRCVTRAPRPPPPSPVSGSRKNRGFSTVRSGSSSPRHWGMRGCFHEGALEEIGLNRDGAEVVWPAWRNSNFPANPMIQPIPAALLQDRLIAISHLARDQEHPDVTLPIQPNELQSCATRKASLAVMHGFLHDEIDSFCKRVAAQNMARKSYITWAVKRVTRSLQVLWPRSRTNIFGSNSTGLALPTSDVDLVVSLPPVRNLEPIKEAGILEGRNGIKETCLQHAARYLANQDWVKNDSLKTVENTAIPIIMLVVEVPRDFIASSSSNVQSPNENPVHTSGDQCSTACSDVIASEESAFPKSPQINHVHCKDSISVRIDISFKSPSHTGLQTTELVKKLIEQFPAAMPLAMVLKQFLADRSLDQSYSGGLSSYCLLLLITRFLQHEHHLGRPVNQNYGSLLMDFLYFFGNVFDPRQMRISVRGSGIYIKRERGCSIDPIHIDDPLFPTNNVGRNCFRIHQCIKAFAEAYSILENESASLSNDDDPCSVSCKLLPKIIPSIDLS